MSEDKIKNLKVQAYDLIARLEQLEATRQELIKQLQLINIEVSKPPSEDPSNQVS